MTQKNSNNILSAFQSHIPFRIKPLHYMVCSILALSTTIVYAQDNGELDVVDVYADAPDDIQNKKIGETVTTAKKIEGQQIQDTRDLVKYETGVTVVEKGRMGASGYAIRGVEENRVNITIDGLQQAETLSSQGFKELFEGYGNFNNTRNGIEVETIEQVNFAKGADSTKVGSGALGGAVIFETKDARDYLLDKNWYYKTKIGYATQNNEMMMSHTLAGRSKGFDALLVRTDRSSHELENYGHYNFPDVPEKGSQGRSRQKADPYSIDKESTLLKFAYNPNDNNRFTVIYDDFKNHGVGTDWSYTLAPLQTDRNKPEIESRHTDDSSNRRNMGLSFENYNSNPLWDSAKITLSQQKISQRASTDEYCDGEDNCSSVQNPLGLKLQNGALVDKNGNKLEIKEVDNVKGTGKTLALVNKETGKALPHNPNLFSGVIQEQNDFWRVVKGKEAFLDCAKVDCNGSLRYWNVSESRDGFNDKNKYFDVDLSSDKVQPIEGSYTSSWGNKTYKQKTYFKVEDIKRGDQHYKKIFSGASEWDSVKKMWEIDDPEYLDSQTNDPYRSSKYRLIIPQSPGYVSNMWTDRKLNTDLKQINLEFEKSFDTKDIEHQLSYGGKFSKSDKSMINYSGYGSENKKWWSMASVTGVDKDGNPTCDGSYSSLCTVKSPAQTFLMPVVTKTGALYLANNVKFNDKLSLDLGYSYENVKHEPHYKQGVNPKLPSGLFAGMFIPREKKPSWWQDKNLDGSDKYTGSSDPKYLADLKEWESNPQKNIDYLTTKTRDFNQNSFSFSGTYDPTTNVRLQAKYSQGFRVPTSDELYFTFKHPDFTIIPNPELNAEKANTQEIAITAHNNNDSYVTLGAFQTDYDDFIELGFKGYKKFKTIDKNGNETESGIPYRAYQNINNSVAKVKGISIDSKVNLAKAHKSLTGFNLGYKLSYQKGKTLGIDTDGNGNEKQIWHAINAISPMKQVASLGYVSPVENYGMDLYWTHMSAKNAKDTYNAYHGADAGIFGQDEGTYAKHLSKSYNILDAVGFYKPKDNITVRAGVYNLFNTEYATWESIRSIRSFGTSNMICKEKNTALGCNSANQGIERFSSPERNFKISLDYKF